eukprot:g13143.t1
MYVVGSKVSNTKVNVNSCTFSANAAKESGGTLAIHERANVILNGVQIDKSIASGVVGDQGGGAAFVSGVSSSLTVKNSVFSNCNANNGGGIKAVQGTLISENLQIKKSMATQDGGAIHASKLSALSILNSIFNENTAVDNNGGGIYFDQSVGTVVGSNMTNNKCSKGGGAIFVNAHSTIALKGTQFKSNEASSQGGAVASQNGNIKLSISSCTFESNNANDDGGSVYTQDSDVTITNTYFSSNQASKKGGSTYFGDSIVRISKGKFSKNKVTDSTLSSGSDIYATNSNVTMLDTELVESISEKNGGSTSMVGSTTGSLNNVVFRSCNAKSRGGALYVEGSQTSIVGNDVSFQSSSANIGGGISIFDSKVKLTNLRCDSVTASTMAGCLHVGGTKGILDVSSGNVSNCKCNGGNDCNGGALAVESMSYLHLLNVNMSQNIATGKGGHMYASDSMMSGTDIHLEKGISSSGGGAIALTRSTANLTTIFAYNNVCDKCCGGAIYLDNSISTIPAMLLPAVSNTATERLLNPAETYRTYSDRNVSGGQSQLDSPSSWSPQHSTTLNSDMVNVNTALGFEEVLNTGCRSYINMDSPRYGKAGGQYSIRECANAVARLNGKEGCQGTHFFYEPSGYCNCPSDDCTVGPNTNAGGPGTLYKSCGNENHSCIWPPWIQMDLGSTFCVAGIVGQGGQQGSNQWLQKYKVRYSNDESSWTSVPGEYDSANDDVGTKREARFGTPVQARYVRIYPTRYHNSISMRVGVLVTDQCASATVTSSKFNLNHGDTGGSVCATSQSKIALHNVEIINNVANSKVTSSCSGGGLLASSGGVVTLDTVFVSNNSAKYSSGGGICGSGKKTQIHVFQSNVHANLAHVNGGGASINLGAYFNVYSSSIFSSNNATQSGGAVAINDDSTFSAGTSVFKSNYAFGKNGGGAFLVSGRDGKDGIFFCGYCNVTSNMAPAGSGGGVFIKEGSAQLTNSYMWNNLAEKGGGAIHSGSYGVLHLEDSRIWKNQVLGGGGGAVEVRASSDVKIISSTLSENSINHEKGQGSALYIYDTKDVLLSQSWLYGSINNAYDALEGGLAYVLSKSTLKVVQSHFVSGKSKAKGGAISVYSDSGVSIESSNFINCSSQLGAALYVESGILNVSSSRFENTAATFDGGAIYSKFTTLNVKSTNFVKSSAKALGGAIYTDDQTIATVKTSTFTELSGRLGAGIYIGRGAAVSVSGSNFHGCKSEHYGTIYAAYNRNKQVVTDTSFTANSAILGGGAITLDSTPMSCENCIFKNNFAGKKLTNIGTEAVGTGGDAKKCEDKDIGKGGAIFTLGQAKIDLKGTVFDNNFAPIGGGIYAAGLSVLTITSSTATNNYVSTNGGFLALEPGSLLTAYELNCESNYGIGFGGCISADIGATVFASESTFKNNTVKTMGGAIYFPGFIGDSSLYGSLINNIFATNGASAGKSIYWNVNSNNKGKGLECHGCTFDGESYAGITTTSLIPNSYNNNLATGAITVDVGFFPTKEIESGMPILSDLNGTVASDDYFRDTEIYLRTRDFYNQIAHFDEKSTCNIERYCPGEATEEEKQKNIVKAYDKTAGVCKDPNTKDVQVTDRSFKIVEPIATASSGFINFKNTIIVAKHSLKKVSLDNRGESSDIKDHNPFSVKISCDIGDKLDFQENIVKQMLVGLCSPGREPDGKEFCVACEAGTYSLSGLACLPCPGGGNCQKDIILDGDDKADVKVQVGVTNVEILPGYYIDQAPQSVTEEECIQDVVNGWKNSSCPPGKFFAKSNNREVCKDLVPDAWGEDRLFRCRANTHIYKCPLAEACQWKNTNGTITQCKVGYKSKLCGSCIKGYYRVSNDTCVACGNEVAETQFLYILAFVFFIQFLILFSYLHLREDGLGLIKMYRSCEKCCKKKKGMPKGRHHGHQRRSNLVSNPKKAGLSRGRSKILAHSAKGKLKRAVTSMSMARRLQQAQEVNEDAKTRFFRPEKWKIMLTFFQIFSQYSSVYEIPWPEKLMELHCHGFLLIVHSKNGKNHVKMIEKKNSGKLFGVQHVEIPRLPMWVQLPVPALSQGKRVNAPPAVMKLNISAWHYRLTVRVRYEQFVDKVQHLFFIILLLAYVPVSGKVMRIFRCIEVGDKYFIMTDLQLECYTTEYNMYASLALACVFVYIVGIPLLFFILLLNARNAGINKIWKNIKNNENRKQFWLAHAKAEKEAQNELWQDPKTEKEIKEIIVGYMKKTNLRSHKAQARFGFICEAYTERAWWFECFELTRKLALTGGVSLISPGSTTQILAGLSFTAFYSYFAMNFKPYVEIGDDLLYNVCLLQLFSVLFIGLLTKLNVSPLQSKYDDIRVDSKDPADLRAAAGNPEPDDFLPWVVIFTHMGCMLFALFSIINEMRTAKRYQKAKRQHEFEKRNRVRQTLRKWAKARRMAMLQQAKRRANGQAGVANESLEDATKKAMEDMEREAEERELEQEMKQLEELKSANKHITETDDADLNAAQRELKEFLMESQHEVSRRKEALKKQVETLERDSQEAAEKFNDQSHLL